MGAITSSYERSVLYGASNMAGARSGCSAIIREKAPLAVYHHCAAHRLNLAIVSACKITAFKNTESYSGEMARFFKFSAKRQRLLDKAISSVCPAANSKKLKDTCKTRWIQHIDSYVHCKKLCVQSTPNLVCYSCSYMHTIIGVHYTPIRWCVKNTPTPCVYNTLQTAFNTLLL